MNNKLKELQAKVRDAIPHAASLINETKPINHEEIENDIRMMTSKAWKGKKLVIDHVQSPTELQQRNDQLVKAKGDEHEEVRFCKDLEDLGISGVNEIEIDETLSEIAGDGYVELKQEVHEQINEQMFHWTNFMKERVDNYPVRHFVGFGMECIGFSVFFRIAVEIFKDDIPEHVYNTVVMLDELQRKSGITTYANDRFAIMDRPKKLHLNERKQLHDARGYAVEFQDGTGLYALNGVAIPEKYFKAGPNNIEGRDVLQEPNVEVRRELIRLIGIERMLAHLPHKVVDKSGNYELLAVDLSSDLVGCKYLKMKNPSIGTFHVEGVANNCRTVQEALNWRAGDEDSPWSPAQLT